MTTPHLSPSLRADNLVFTAGQLAFDETGVINGDVGEQTRVAIARLQQVLRPHGLDLQDIVKTTVFITRSEDFVAFNEAYAHAFGPHKPTRSTVIAGLAATNALVEIEAIALVRT
jgi:2-iminobutanoate/2-iminopropanoate deaminase